MDGESLRVNPNRSGWNTYVRSKYEESRRALLTCCCAGFHGNDILADDMRRKRAVFKPSVRRCKRGENLMRAETLASKLRLGKEVKVMAGRGKKLPQSVDGFSGGNNITKMWKDNYSGILNDFIDAHDKEDLRQMLADSPRGQIKLTFAE